MCLLNQRNGNSLGLLFLGLNSVLGLDGTQRFVSNWVWNQGAAKKCAIER